MINPEFRNALLTKQYFRFTGPPEHWLTAVKAYTWGLKINHLSRWQKINVGDVFLMHSTLSERFKGTRSAIIGIGVVGPGLRQKDNFLWQEEFEKKTNIYPLLVPFSEIYLFSKLNTSQLEKWNFQNIDNTAELVQILLKDAIGRPEGFPAMGSFSSVNREMALSVLDKYNLPPNLLTNDLAAEDIEGAATSLEPVKNAVETLRFVPTLKYLGASEEEKIISFNKRVSIFERDNELLERATNTHRKIIDETIKIMKAKGYDTLANLHADLVAVNESEIVLFEAKSFREGGFRDQARRAVGQLYQYEYFDIADFQEKALTNKPVKKSLLVPIDPYEPSYLDFLKWAKIDTYVPDLGLSQLVALNKK